MTTPEKFRRRQRIEGVLLVVLGLFTVGYVLYDSHEAHRRDDCVAEAFHDFSTSLSVRSDLTVKTDRLQLRAEKLQDQAIFINKRVVEDVSAAQDQDDVAAAFVRFNRADDHVDALSDQLDKRIARVTTKRVKTSIPPFPSGKCG